MKVVALVIALFVAVSVHAKDHGTNRGSVGSWEGLFVYDHPAVAEDVDSESACIKTGGSWTHGECMYQVRDSLELRFGYEGPTGKITVTSYPTICEVDIFAGKRLSWTELMGLAMSRSGEICEVKLTYDDNADVVTVTNMDEAKCPDFCAGNPSININNAKRVR